LIPRLVHDEMMIIVVKGQLYSLLKLLKLMSKTELKWFATHPCLVGTQQKEFINL